MRRMSSARRRPSAWSQPPASPASPSAAAMAISPVSTVARRTLVQAATEVGDFGWDRSLEPHLAGLIDDADRYRPQRYIQRSIEHRRLPLSRTNRDLNG